MKFLSLIEGTVNEDEELKSQYKSARGLGKIYMGENYLFIKSAFKVFYLPYSNIQRAFRRVLLVPAKMCCGSGDLEIEHLVVCSKDKELCDYEMPGKKSVEAALAILKEKCPEAIFTCPKKPKTPGTSAKSINACKNKTSGENNE